MGEGAAGSNLPLFYCSCNGDQPTRCNPHLPILISPKGLHSTPVLGVPLRDKERRAQSTPSVVGNPEGTLQSKALGSSPSDPQGGFLEELPLRGDLGGCTTWTLMRE